MAGRLLRVFSWRPMAEDPAGQDFLIPIILVKGATCAASAVSNAGLLRQRARSFRSGFRCGAHSSCGTVCDGMVDQKICFGRFKRRKRLLSSGRLQDDARLINAQKNQQFINRSIQRARKKPFAWPRSAREKASGTGLRQRKRAPGERIRSPRLSCASRNRLAAGCLPNAWTTILSV